MKLRTNILYTLLFILILFAKGSAQDYPLEIDYYNFIHYDKNILEYEGNAKQYYDRFFEKTNKLVLQGDQLIHILHIGDSHIQADYFPGQMRNRIQTLNKDGISARGFLFPFRAAKTNNPPDFKVETTTQWERCRSVTKGYGCALGIAGINIKSSDSISTLTIKAAEGDYLPYSFNKIRIFHNLQEVYYDIEVLNYEGPVSRTYHYDQGLTEIEFKHELNRVDLRFTRLDSIKAPFVFHGISFESNDPGIVYSSVGVNGAETRSFNKCYLLQNQLKALNPDWMIISLGTNDAYMRNFNSANFYANYDTLISRIREVLPDAALLLTVPGDSYRSRRNPNYNTSKARDQIKLLAKKHHAAVWDFYEIMGGQNSINYWYAKGLANRDKLHFTKAGYKLQGDLLFNAFLKSYDSFNLNRMAN